MDIGDQGEDYLARYRQRIDENARAWLAALRPVRKPLSLAKEQDNLVKAAWQALREPAAWETAVDLVDALFPYLEGWGQWQILDEMLETALAISRQVGSLAQEADMLQNLGQLARSRGKYHEARDRLYGALEISRGLGDHRRACRALAHLGPTHLALGQIDKADLCTTEATALAEEIHSFGETGLVLTSTGILHLHQGWAGGAVMAFGQALGAYAAAAHQHGMAQALNNLGEAYRQLQCQDKALGCWQQALGLFKEVGDELGVNRTRLNLSLLHHEQGRTSEALALVRRVEPVIRRVGDLPAYARILHNTGLYLDAQGRPTEAFAAYRAAADVHLRTGDRLAAASALTGVAHLCLDNGLAAEAQDALQWVQAIEEETGQAAARLGTIAQAWLDIG